MGQIRFFLLDATARYGRQRFQRFVSEAPGCVLEARSAASTINRFRPYGLCAGGSAIVKGSVNRIRPRAAMRSTCRRGLTTLAASQGHVDTAPRTIFTPAISRQGSRD